MTNYNTKDSGIKDHELSLSLSQKDLLDNYDKLVSDGEMSELEATLICFKEGLKPWPKPLPLFEEENFEIQYPSF